MDGSFCYGVEAYEANSIPLLLLLWMEETHVKNAEGRLPREFSQAEGKVDEKKKPGGTLVKY